MLKKKKYIIDLTTIMCKLLNNLKDMQHIYEVSVEDLIVNIINTSDLNVVLVLKNSCLERFTNNLVKTLLNLLKSIILLLIMLNKLIML
jgi:hypothetical protein